MQSWSCNTFWSNKLPYCVIEGSATIFVPLGGTYNDPINATENGAPIAYTSTGAGKYRNGKTLDLNVADEYVQTYKAVNKDGFSRTIDEQLLCTKMEI